MDYLALQKKTQKAFKKDGFGLQVLVITQGAFNATLDTMVTTIATYDAYGIYTEYDTSEIVGSIAQINDRKLLVDAVGKPDLTTADSVSFLVDSVSLDVGEIKPLKPGNVTVFYTVRVKG